MAMSPKQRSNSLGLTLIEVLIALAIIGMSLTAVIKATSQNIHSTGYLQTKTTAMWVGLQAINELRANVAKSGSSSGSQKLTTEMLGREWFWQYEKEETPNPRIKKLTVKVFAKESDEEADAPIITLESYTYHAQTYTQ